MVAEAAIGQVGIILALEVSRVSRSNHDWYRLLDICAITGTLIADAEGIYDPRAFNDRLLLGLKATMSETELHIMKQRLAEAVRAKAVRGDFRCRLPTGFVWGLGGRNIAIAPVFYGSMGQGCVGSSGTPALAALLGSSPQVGATFLASVTNLPAPFAGVLLTGFSNSSYQGNPLPYSLAGLGAPSCSVQVAPESTAFVLGRGGQAVAAMGIPNNAGLIGVRFFHQFAALDAAANGLGLTVSNAALGCVR